VFDLTGDGNVDQADVILFRNCLTGPGKLYGPANLPDGCTLPLGSDGKLPVDPDKDSDVDLDDFGCLQRCFGHAGETTDPMCLN
jgi:hypothetical protein